MDNAMIVESKGSASFIDFKDHPPKRCLDIGTGVSPPDPVYFPRVTLIALTARSLGPILRQGMAGVHIREPHPLALSLFPSELTWVQVGIDMVNMQVPLQVLEPEIAQRVEWLHTNM